MFKVRVLTPAYLLTGEVEENSAFLGWLNNKDKNVLNVHNVEAILLDPNTTIPATATKMATIHKSQVVGIAMLSPDGQRTIKVSDRAQLAVLYTAHFIIQANLHPPGEMGIDRIPDVAKANFVPATTAKLHPLLPVRNLPDLEEKLIILNWSHVNFYHAR